MNLAGAIIEMLRRPGIVALAPPQRMLSLSDAGYLLKLGTAKRQYARLCARDFLREDWACVTPDELEALAEQSRSGGES
jgi:hypothetical protein